jgi:hypothetical protein
LRGAEARTAGRILARPSRNERSCDPERPLCFHWGNQVSAADVAATEAAFAAVYDLEVGAYGYLPPLPDGARGGNSKTDVYLRDIGPQLFGYCTSDDPSSSPDVHAYCVVDDDFAEFGNSQTRAEFRDITAAHEYFHAVQYAYDSREDLWLMEGSAMLMEGQFRPSVEDRIRYLEAASVLTSPATPVDFGDGGFEYSAWLYWRFLVEQFGELADPLVIREIWELAAGAGTDTDGPGPDTVGENFYSLAATRKVIAARGQAFRTLFAKFTRANRAPATFYAEGADYPRAPLAGARTLAAGASTAWRTTALPHLASASYVFRRGASVAADARLRIAVDLPRRYLGPEARVLVRMDNDIEVQRIQLDPRGFGARTVRFGETVTGVDLVLTNASTRMNCWEGTPYSCAGLGRDDLRSYGYRVAVR